MKFYQLVTGENTKGIFLFDLLLTNQGTEFQIDSLHIDNNTLILYEIKAYLVFVHDSFMLYQVPLGYPAIFPSQLTRFQQSIQINRTSISSQTKNIANTISALDIGESRYAKYPVYSYKALQKGIVCSIDCGGLLQNHTKQLLRCPRCKKVKSISSALEETITELQFPFPERNITTGNIREWCNNASYQDKNSFLLS